MLALGVAASEPFIIASYVVEDSSYLTSASSLGSLAPTAQQAAIIISITH
jgi:hypothetical protein